MSSVDEPEFPGESPANLEEATPNNAGPAPNTGGAVMPIAAGFDSNDPRIHFDQTTGKWQYEDDDGNGFEWDDRKEAWAPLVDEDLIRAQQAAYGVQGVDEEAPAAPVNRRGKKRKEEDYTSNGPVAGSSENKKLRGGERPPRAPRPVTSVFVTGLPLDATVEEIADVFGRYGVLLEDDAGAPRIKLYNDTNTGAFRGEALVVYFKPESVELAVNILDESCLRASRGQNIPLMRVQKADFGKGGNSEGKSGELGGNAQPSNGAAERRKPLSEQEKKRVQRRMAKMQGKLDDWDSSDEDSPFAATSGAHGGRSTQAANGGARPSSVASGSAAPNSRVVVLKHMFTLAELDEDPSLLLDLKEDVREECENLGKVTNVVLYDKEPQGIMTVKFGTPESAQACVMKMDGRFFGGRQVEAFLAEGKLKFRRTATHDDDEEQRRAESFGLWLEAGGDEA